MNCEHCAPFGAALAVQGPGEFESIVERVRQAVADGVLEYNAFESEQDLAGQPSFLSLDLAGPWPDVMRYRFECPQCGRRFDLTADAYHGLGGVWRAVR